MRLNTLTSSRRALFAALAAATLAAACGSSDSPTQPGGPPDAVLAAGDTEIRANQRLTFNLLNTGGTNLTFRACINEVQRLEQGEWRDVPLPAEWDACPNGERTLAPDAAAETSFLIPGTFLPGTYRVAYAVWPSEGDGQTEVMTVYSTSFIVLA